MLVLFIAVLGKNGCTSGKVRVLCVLSVFPDYHHPRNKLQCVVTMHYIHMLRDLVRGKRLGIEFPHTEQNTDLNVCGTKACNISFFSL